MSMPDGRRPGPGGRPRRRDRHGPSAVRPGAADGRSSTSTRRTTRPAARSRRASSATRTRRSSSAARTSGASARRAARASGPSARSSACRSRSSPTSTTRSPRRTARGSRSRTTARRTGARPGRRSSSTRTAGSPGSGRRSSRRATPPRCSRPSTRSRQARAGVTGSPARRRAGHETRLRSWGETSEASTRHHSRAIALQPRFADGPCVPPVRRPHADCPVSDEAPHDWRPDRFMVIVAHPDDADFGPAATAAALDRRGLRRLARLLHERRRRRRGPRPRSARAGRRCAKRSSGAPPTIVGYAGRDVPPPARRRARQRPRPARAPRPRDPDVPAGRGPGHRSRGRLLPRRRRQPHRPPGRRAWPRSTPSTRRPATRWRSRGSPESGLAAHVVRRLYLFWPNEPNARVDVTATIDRKIDALRAHASQIKEPEKLEERIREWATEEGEPIGVEAGEAFRLVVIDDDEDEGPDAPRQPRPPSRVAG